jgi:LysM repeat protein
MNVHTLQTTRPRIADVGKGLAALAGMAALVVGVPVALLAWVGSPLPAEVPSVSDVTDAIRDTYIPDSFLVKALALVCWLVWAELLASLLVEAVALARGRKAGAVPFAGRVQRAAARLVAGVALLGVLVATRDSSGPDRAEPSTLLPPPGTLVTYVTDPVETPNQPAPPAPAPAGPAPTYEVQRRDTLWDIAERHLGDPFRWPEIFELNRGRPQADGTCLTDPDLIYAGWVLDLPADAVGLAPAPAPPAPAPAPAPSTTGGPGVTPGSSRVIDGGMVLIDDDGDDNEDTGDNDETGGVVLVGESVGQAAGDTTRSAHPDPAAADPGVMVLLPEPGRSHDDEIASAPVRSQPPAARPGDPDD